MKIDIARLADQREVVLAEDWDAELLDLNGPGWRYASPIHLEAVVVKDAAIIRVQVRLRGRTTLACGRCLKEFDGSLDKKLNFVYSVDLSNKTLVLDEDIRQELILDFPQKVLCRQDCKGLCSRCGEDLNEGSCRCN